MVLMSPVVKLAGQDASTYLRRFPVWLHVYSVTWTSMLQASTHLSCERAMRFAPTQLS